MLLVVVCESTKSGLNRSRKAAGAESAGVRDLRKPTSGITMV